MRQLGAGRPAFLVLLELIAVLGIVEEVRKVVEQLHAVALRIRRQPRRIGGSGPLPVSGGGVPVRLAAIRFFDESKSVDEAGIDGPLRDLIGGMPVVREAEKGQRQAVSRIPLAVPEDAVVLVLAIRADPRAVVLFVLERSQQMAAADARRDGAEKAAVVERAAGHRDDRPIKHVEVVDVGGARGRKVAVLGVIGSLSELHAADQLRDHEVGVGIALRVRMCRHVHRKAGNRLRKVEPVIEIEPAQIVLIRFALSAVLADDHARHRLEHFGRAVNRANGQLRGGDGAFARGGGDADEVLGRVLDFRQVTERAWRSDDDVRAGGDEHHRIRGKAAARGHGDRSAYGAEVDQAEDQFGTAGADVVEPVDAGAVGDRLDQIGGVCRPELHRHAGEHAAGLVRYGASDSAGSLCGGRIHPDDRDRDNDDGEKETGHQPGS
jgi:hypothetical protein